MTPTAHGHRHGRTCYWDHMTCGWVCAAPPPEAAAPELPEVPDRAEPEVAPEPQPA
jgi:hypothetical protein